MFYYETTQLPSQFGSCLFTVGYFTEGLFHRVTSSALCLHGDIDQNSMNILLSDMFISFCPLLPMALFVSLEFNNTRKYMHSFDLMQLLM